MKNLRKLMLLVALVGVAFAGRGQAMSSSDIIPDETLKYVVTYKWGLVQKDAGTATISLRRNGGNYNMTLTARTLPWADKIFMVRDTLKSVVRINGLQPLKYTKISHEGKKYAKDVVEYVHQGKITLGKCTRYRIKDGKMTAAHSTLSASGPVYDMLSIFYYIRRLDYSKIGAGKVVKVTVFSGSKSETLYLKNLGLTTVTLRNNQKVKAYKVSFRFTMGGKTESSEQMTAWISADSRHIPVSVTGILPVGQVRCYITNY